MLLIAAPGLIRLVGTTITCVSSYSLVMVYLSAILGEGFRIELVITERFFAVPVFSFGSVFPKVLECLLNSTIF